MIFNGSMVCAILGGRKTKTRRVIKPQPPQSAGDIEESDKHAGEFFYWLDGSEKSTSFLCPYGRPKERLWVREAWQAGMTDCGPAVGYRTDRYRWHPPYEGPFPYDSYPTTSWRRGYWLADVEVNGPWRPGIHMPRWASRLTLEVVSVRVERLQDIDFVDIRAEGVRCPEHDFESGLCCSECPALRAAFASLWDGINGKRPGCDWAANPWVWVVEFKRLEQS